MTDPATQPEAPAEPQQPATAPHSDAHGQREQLRERVAALFRHASGDERPGNKTPGEIADVVLPFLDEELQQLREELRLTRVAAEAGARAYGQAEARAQTAEAGLVESNWPDGGPGDDPPEVKLATMRQRAEAAEQERDTLRAHVDADHQVLAQVRHHVDRLRDWCRDPEATVTIAGSICADLQKTLDGDVDE